MILLLASCQNILRGVDKSYAYEHDVLEDEPYFKMQLLSSWDGKTTTLVCNANIILSSRDYAHALREFANHVEDLGVMDTHSVS